MSVYCGFFNVWLRTCCRIYNLWLCVCVGLVVCVCESGFVIVSFVDCGCVYAWVRGCVSLFVYILSILKCGYENVWDLNVCLFLCVRFLVCVCVCVFVRFVMCICVIWV